MFGMKAEIALREKGLSFDRVMVPYSGEKGYSPKHEDVLRINPKKQVPVLTDGDLEIFDSTQIFEYLEDIAPTPALWPAAPADRARARQLELTADEIYFPHVFTVMMNYGNEDESIQESAREELRTVYRQLEPKLDSQEYLSGAFSFADIAFFMAQVFGDRHGAPITGSTPNLLAWRDRVAARPSVRPVMQELGAYLTENGRPVPDFIAGL